MEPSKNNDEPKRLYRSKVDRLVAGVCGGVAEYFEVDSTLVRILWLIIIFFTGFWLGVLLYLIALVVMRDNPNQSFADRKPQSVALYVGIGFVLLGLLFLSNRWDWYYFRPFHFHFFKPWFFHWDRFWPIILILLGALYLFYALKRPSNGQTEPAKNEPISPSNRLFRSRDEKIIGGVCGGLAQYLNVDPALIRILWVIISLATGVLFAIIIYIVWMIVVPESSAAPGQSTSTTPNSPIAAASASQRRSKRTRRPPTKEGENE